MLILAPRQSHRDGSGVELSWALAVCVPTRRFNGGADPCESSPNVTLCREGSSAPLLVTPNRWAAPGIAWFPFATVIGDPSRPPHPHTASRHASLLLVRGVG